MNEALRRARELGLRRSAPMILHVARRRFEAPVRARRARAGAYRVGFAEALQAAGTPTAGEAFRRALVALPSVRLAAEVPLSETAYARAEKLLRREFDLLGSGPITFGPAMDWSRDPVSGARWPLKHFSSLPLAPCPGADVKWPWELSRCQHLPLLALAYRVDGDRRFVDEIGRQLVDWRLANPVEFGVNWLCTMDVAIRGANWVAAVALLADAGLEELWFADALAAVVEHARFIRRTLEYGVVRGNHYLADVVGLLVCCAPFADAASDMVGFTIAALELEASIQLALDGCAREASVAYHGLVTELFLIGREAAEGLRPGSTTPVMEERIARAMGFARAITRPDGLIPSIGDADDGRILPLARYGDDPRSFSHLFDDATRPERAAEVHGRYRDGGFWLLEEGDLYVLVRCGDVGLEGLGSHAHNDQLAVEICFGDQPIVVDPGSYVYMRDILARNAFRSTACHSTVQVDGREQAPLDRIFGLDDRARAECTEFGERIFVGQHRAYEPTVCTRRVEVGKTTPDGASVRIHDAIAGTVGVRLDWAFPLAPGAVVELVPGGAIASWPGVVARFEGSSVDWAVDTGWYSPRYGVREPTTVIRASRMSASEGSFTIRVSETPSRTTLVREPPATASGPRESGA